MVIENGNDTYTEEFHITNRKVNKSSQKPIYKLVGGNYYIHYIPDAYGWRYGQIDGNTFDDFDYESKHNSISWETESVKCYKYINYCTECLF